MHKLITMWVWNFWKFQRDTLRQSKLMLIVGVHAWSLGRNMNSTSHGRSFRPTCSSFFSQSFVFINFFQAIVHVHIISISISVPFWLYCVISYFSYSILQIHTSEWLLQGKNPKMKLLEDKTSPGSGDLMMKPENHESLPRMQQSL